MNNLLELRDFLKKYSNISNLFIDDFFSLYTIDTQNDDFIIDFDNLVKWLNIRKDSLKRSLINNYIINIDYKINKIKNTKPGKPNEIIMITGECCKKLCMLSKTEKSEEVRNYFISIEKLLNKYKKYIIEQLNKRIDILENNMKPIENKTSGIIYVLKTDYDIIDLYKIGKTKKFKERIRNHNNSHINNVNIVYIFETEYLNEVEKCLKNVLLTKQYKKRKEFYEIDLDLLKELIENCNNLSLKVRNNKNKKKQGGYYVMLDK